MGPLTSLALSVKLDPSLPEKLKGLCVMGGNVDSRGNTTVCGGFNFAADPEAAYIVLNRFYCPTYCHLGVCLPGQSAMGFHPTETILKMMKLLDFGRSECLECKFMTFTHNQGDAVSRSVCKTWLAQDTEKARFMKKIFKHMKEVMETVQYKREMVAGEGFTPCDSYAVAAAINDSFVTEIEQHQVAVTVELDGTNTRGMMVMDYMELLNKKHKAFIMKKVDLDMFKTMLMDSMK